MSHPFNGSLMAQDHGSLVQGEASPGDPGKKFASLFDCLGPGVIHGGILFISRSALQLDQVLTALY